MVPEPSAPINLDLDSARRRQQWTAPKAPSEPARARTKETEDSGAEQGWTRHVSTALLVVGAVALLAVATLGGPSEEEKAAGPVRPTSFRLGVARDRGGAPEVLLDSATAQIGDQLSFTVSLPEATPVVLVKVNANGDVTPIFPAQGTEAVAIPEGESTLPVTVALAGNPGMDRFVALACAKGMSVADASTLALGVPESGKVPPMYPGCQESVVRLRKLL